MLDIAKQTIDFYMKNLQTPKIYDLYFDKRKGDLNDG